MRISKRSVPVLIAILVSGYGAQVALAQTNSDASTDASYVPLVGISVVPDPLALPKGPGDVTYHYAVKNFIPELPLSNVQVTDDKCSPPKFIGGDDNGDNKLDYSETWRYTCTTKIPETTQSIATVIATANNLPAAHKAYATVVVGSDKVAPLVNIINITKVAYPLTLPIGGGEITFTYRVNNPGTVPLSDVTVTDDKCSAMSGKLGDTNGNGLLDITEVWVYTCTTHLTQTTTNTVTVEASANGLKAVGYATITITVALLPVSTSTNLFDVGISPEASAQAHSNTIIWATLSIILVGLIAFFMVARGTHARNRKKHTSSR